MDLYLYIGLVFNVRLTPNEYEVISHHEFDLHSPGGSDSKESACIAGDLSSIPGLGKFPGEGNGYPLQYTEEPGRLQCVGSQRVGHD